MVGLEAEVPSYPLVATNLPSGHSFCHHLIIIIVIIIVIIVIIVNIVNIGSQGVSRGGGAVKKPSCMREDLSVIESDLSEGLPRIVHGGGSPL